MNQEVIERTTESPVNLPLPKILNIRTYPDPILNTPCKLVDSVTPEIKALIQNMFLTMYNTGGVGLSANQVGELHRVIVMDTSASGSRRQAFINPEIIESNNVDRWKEGCLSFPDIFVYVKRPTFVKVKAIDENGKDVELTLEGIDAVCLQHEIDHLNGITFYDRLSPLQKNLIKKRIKALK